MADFIFFELAGLAKDAFRVVSFSGTEAISAPFAYELDLLSPEEDVDFEAVLGKPARLRIEGTGGDRYVHGLVRRIEETSRALNGTRLAVSLVPDLWRLSLRQNSRIFQNQTVPDVVKKVLGDAKVPASDLQMTLHGKHEPWEYCVQYRESDLAFVSRLLEQEGIFYFLQHGEEKAVLRFGDTPDDHPAAPEVGTLPVRASAGMAGDAETVLRLVVTQEVRPDAAEVRDYNFKKPDLNLKGAAKDGPGLGTEVYDAPGEYDLPDEGKEIARIRLQELRATRRLCSGETTCNRLMPGHTFTVSKHPRADLDDTYLVLEVTQHGSQPQVLGDEGAGQPSTYACTFRCIPLSVPYRPPRVTPRPLAQGAQTAIVVGPPGEEVHTDEYGRIKVQFHWDREGKRNDASSCWMRVAQAWAGSGWGAMVIPRINQEVIVEFLDGDPDQPIVTGCVYNANNMPPYPLGADKTKSTIKSNSSKGGGGFNEIRFEDKKGAEEIYVHAQKDQNIQVLNNESLSVGVDRTKTIGNNETTQVGNDRTETVGNNETITVNGARTETVAQNETISILGSRTETVAGMESITIGGSRSENVAISESIVVGASRSVTVGASETATVALQRTHTVGLNETITVGVGQEVTVGGLQMVSVGGLQAINVGAARMVNVAMSNSMNVGKEESHAVGTSFLVDAGDSVTLKAGASSLTLSKDGTIVIKGKDISIVGSGKINAKASSDVVIKGSKVGIN